MTKNTKILSFVILTMLIAAMAFTLCSCDKNQVDKVGTEFSFTFEITEGEAEYTKTEEGVFLVKTNEETVGDALYALGLIDGEEGSYGLYIKSVNGIVADYDADSTYWSFYIDGEYAMTGASSTPIEAEKTYTFKIEK